MEHARRPTHLAESKNARAWGVTMSVTMRRAKKVAFVLVPLALLVGGASLAFGPVVRKKVAAEADKRHLDVQVGGVRPGFFAVSLRDVVVTPRGVEGVRAEIPEVRVELSAAFKPREVVARGGKLTLEGELDVLTERLKAWRSQGGGGGEAKSAPGRAELRAEGLAVVWRAEGGLGVEAAGVGLVRGDDGYRVAVEAGKATFQGGAVEVAGLTVDADAELALRSLRAAAVTVSAETKKPELATARPVRDEARDPTPPPLPLAAAGKRSGKNVKAAGLRVEGPIERPFTLPMPDLRGQAARLSVVEKALGKRLPEGATVDIKAMRVAVKAGGDTVTLGPGPLAVVRRPDRVHVSFSTEKDAQGTQLAVTADLPVGKGDLRLELSGGPVTLAQIGVTEGMLGLTDVGRATLAGRGQIVLAEGGESVTFDAQLKTRGLTITQPRVATETIRGLDLDVGARGLLAASGTLRLDHADLEIGQLRAAAHGTVVQEPDHLAVSLTADAYPASCQGIVDSMPHALVPTIKGARVAGTFGGHGRLAFDTRRIDDLVLDYRFDSSCRLTEVPPDLARERFRRPFRHRVYAPDGTQHDESTGPGSGNWTDLDRISPYMQVAVMTTEDGGFYKHHGFNHPAFRNSLVANLKAGRFVRGASTISMQLAKNLFLFRDKTLARKLEELVLTDYIEQVFSKEELMELYLNVIEFGPNVYGITRAADHYFGRKPEELDLAECMFLSTLLPSPIRFHHIYDRGQVPDAWMSHLHTLLGIAEKTHRISPRELEDGRKQTIVFYKPGNPRPAPRPAVTARYGDGDEAGWEPVD